MFESKCRYDVILGGDFLEKIGMNLLYKSLEIEWLGNVMPMETINKPDQVASQVEQHLSQLKIDDMGLEIDSYLSAPIMDAKYEKLDIPFFCDYSLLTFDGKPAEGPTGVAFQTFKIV